MSKMLIMYKPTKQNNFISKNKGFLMLSFVGWVWVWKSSLIDMDLNKNLTI